MPTRGIQGQGWLLKAVIFAVLIGMVVLLRRHYQLAEHIEPMTLLGFALVLLVAYTLAAILAVLKIPRISVYLVVGLLAALFARDLFPPSLGPLLLPDGVLGPAQRRELEPLKMLALSLIALIAGGTLKLELLRTELRTVLGIVTLQTVLVFLVTSALVFSVSGGIPMVSVPALLALTEGDRWALAALFSAGTLVTSPVAALAIIHESRADGPMTRTVLTSVIVKDALAMLAFAIILAGTSRGLADGPQSGGLGIATHIAVSLLLGAVLGVALGLYLRYINTEVPLVVLAATYLSTFVAQKSQLDPFVLFLAAGAVATNFSDRTSQLIRSVRSYSLPLFLVVFVIEGAGLELLRVVDYAVLVPVLCLLRVGALWTGLRAALRLSGGDPNTERFGWTGFVAQASYVAPLLAIVAANFGPAGAAMAAALLAAVALNELLGPILFRMGLGLAGELAETPQELSSNLPTSSLPSAAPPSLDGEEPFGPALESSSPRLNELVAELEAELGVLERDLRDTVLGPMREEMESFLLELRREFLRYHRRCLMDLRAAEDQVALKAALRRDLTELADRWRGLVLDRSARVTASGWRAADLILAIDRVVAKLPRGVSGPFEPESYQRHPGDSLARRTWRLGIRLARWAREGLGYPPPARTIALQDVARYHLAGLLPARLEALAASLVAAEGLLSERTQSLFSMVRTGMELLVVGPEEQNAISSDLNARLGTFRREFELELGLGLEDLRGVLNETELRARRLLLEAASQLKSDLRISGTPDLPTQARRFGRVYKDRMKGLHRLTEVYDELRENEAAQYALLALDLELLGLEESARGPLEDQADQLARLIRGRGKKQLERLVEAVDAASAQLDTAMASERRGEQLADALRVVAENLNRVAQDVLETTRTLRDDFTDERAATPVLDRLLQSAQSLTEVYVVPSGRLGRGEWRLPNPVPTVEVSFRKSVVGFIQTSVSKRLIQVVRDLSEQLTPVSVTVEEQERVLSFNFEVASSELDVFEEGEVPLELIESTRAGVKTELARVKAKLSELRARCEPWPVQARDTVIHAVLDCLSELRDRAAEGRLPALRLALLGEAGVGQRLVREAVGLGGWARQVRTRAWKGVKSALGEDRLDALRRWLGVPAAEGQLRIGRETFAFRDAAAELPASYRRLFSGQVLEAGDVLTGRDAELMKARAVLTRTGAGRGLRSVIVVGPEPVGNGAVVGSIARGLGISRVRRLDLDEPVSVEEVRRWFAESVPNQLNILTGFRWLFSLRRGGFEPLREWVRGIVRDGGKEAWLVSAESPVWRFAGLIAPVAEAFAERITLKPLTRDQLEAAILARHQMSGYRLAIETDATWIVRRLFRGEKRRHDATQDLWFRSLHAATGGQLQDALMLWLASIEKVSEESKTVELGPVRRRPLSALRRLPESVLLTLRQTCAQGWIDAEIYACTFRVSELEAEAHLCQLSQLGLLSPDGARFEIAPHLAAPIQRILRERRWLT